MVNYIVQMLALCCLVLSKLPNVNQCVLVLTTNLHDLYICMIQMCGSLRLRRIAGGFTLQWTSQAALASNL